MVCAVMFPTISSALVGRLLCSGCYRRCNERENLEVEEDAEVRGLMAVVFNQRWHARCSNYSCQQLFDARQRCLLIRSCTIS